MLIFVALGACCFSSRSRAAELYCGGAENPVCALYQVCRQALDLYPESEVAGAGKECVLTIAGRRIIIRRKLVDGESRYFFYLKKAAGKRPKAVPGRKAAGPAALPAAPRAVRGAGPKTAVKKTAGRKTGKERNGISGQTKKRKP